MTPVPLFAPAFALIASAVLLILSGCALAPAGDDATAASREASATAGQSLSEMKTWQYILIDAEPLGVVTAADDGRYTYLAFATDAPTEDSYFDAEGEPLTLHVRQGRVAAIAGIHAGGILVRRVGPQGNDHAFIAPNPRATAGDRPNLDADPDLVTARARLENLATQGPAYRRAIERAQHREREPRPAAPRGLAGWTPMAATGASTAGASTVAAGATGQGGGLANPPRPGSHGAALASSPALALAAPAGPGRPALPAAGGYPGHDDLGFQRTPNGSLVRVFFASGGRAIVRPDDGLRRLEAEAQSADEIHIAGYTDAVGSDEQNAGLARARAEAIRALLLKRGIPSSRISVTWTGTGRYLADNRTEQGRALNRRVEVLFVQSGRRVAERGHYDAR